MGETRMLYIYIHTNIYIYIYTNASLLFDSSYIQQRRHSAGGDRGHCNCVMHLFNDAANQCTNLRTQQFDRPSIRAGVQRYVWESVEVNRQQRAADPNESRS